MSESFVYCWTNHTNNRIYVGYHKGLTDDGYVCSSKSEEFWNDFNNPQMKWSRQVIARGKKEDCISLEYKILKSLNLNEVYNNSCSKGIVHTDEVRRKISNALSGRSWSKSQREKIEEYHSNNRGSNFGRSFSEETKEKMSKARYGKTDTKTTKTKKSLAAKKRWETKRNNNGV